MSSDDFVPIACLAVTVAGVVPTVHVAGVALLNRLVLCDGLIGSPHLEAQDFRETVAEEGVVRLKVKRMAVGDNGFLPIVRCVPRPFC